MRGALAQKAEVLLTAIIAVCAVTLTVLSIRRSGEARGRQQMVTAEVEDWESFRSGRIVYGNRSAKVRAVVFSDFQCPYCSVLASRLDTLLLRYPADFSVEFRHFPLQQIHPWAELAARVSECANAVGKFKAVHDSLFSHGSRLYPTLISQLALQAGVTDTSWLHSCLTSADTERALRSDSIAGAALRVAGTPTTLFNRMKVVGAPTVPELDSILHSLLKSK